MVVGVVEVGVVKGTGDVDEEVRVGGDDVDEGDGVEKVDCWDVDVVAKVSGVVDGMSDVDDDVEDSG